MALAFVGLAHLVFGYLAGEWPAVLLPIAVLPMAITAGYPKSQVSEPGLVWFGQLLWLLAEVALIAAGLGLRALVHAPTPRL